MKRDFREYDVVDWGDIESEEERIARELREKMIKRDKKINQILEK